MDNKCQVFISYRRNGAVDLAGRIRDHLAGYGYQVFYDYRSINEGDYRDQIFNAIRECTDFLLVLPEHGMDTCNNPEDWLYQEIKLALECDKNIIPIFAKPPFEWPKNLPDEIKDVQYKQAVSNSNEYFEAMISLIMNRLHSKNESGSFADGVSENAKERSVRQYDVGKTAFDKGDYNEAFNRFMKAAELGNGSAQYMVGSLYENGYGVGKSLSDAFAWYEKAADCRMNSSNAQFKCGMMKLKGIGTDQDDIDAQYWFEQAEKQGHIGAIKQLAMMNGDDPDKQVALLEKAAEAGDAESQEVCGEHYLKKGDLVNAMKYHQKAAEQGRVLPMYRVAEDYMSKGKENDLTKAHELYAKIADEDSEEYKEYSASASRALGDMDFFGVAGEPDYKNAFEYYKKALAKDQSTKNRLAVADMFYYGIGTERNLFEADNLYAECGDDCRMMEKFNIAFYGDENTGRDWDRAMNLAASIHSKVPGAGMSGVLGDMYFFGSMNKDDVLKARELYACRTSDFHKYQMVKSAFYNKDSRTDKLWENITSIKAYRFADAQLMYELGSIVLYNGGKKEAALEIFRNAADRQYPPAMYMLANMYYYGIGTEANAEEAKKYFEAVSELFDGAKEKLVLCDRYAAYQHFKSSISLFPVELNPGDVLSFGRYPQGKNGEEAPIEWKVLKREGNKALLISKYLLDAKEYNKEYVGTTWAECTLRTWLNKEFLNKAFTSEEQRVILEEKHHTENSKYGTKGGKDTEDKVFLLSVEEAKELFTNNKERKGYATEYAKGQEAYVDDETGGSWWWLRSPGFIQDSAAFVDVDGSVDERGSLVSHVRVCVRPAIWINL